MACRLSIRCQSLLSRSVTQLRNTENSKRASSTAATRRNSLFSLEKQSQQESVPLAGSALFSKEKNAQVKDVGRIYKIKVGVHLKDGSHEILLMNKSLSTPTHCAWHLNKNLVERSVIALVDGKPWDMSRPLEDSCKLEYLTMLDENPSLCNKVFWRSCSFMLGAVVSNAFKDSIPVTLHSFPPPNVSSGSFVLDAAIGLDEWNPSPEELRTLSAEMMKLSDKMLPFERLEVSLPVAQEMFADNPFKLEHIKQIHAEHNNVVVYRLGDHVDISRGPMMGRSNLLGRCTIASVHKMDELYRFQGVALPTGIRLNHFAYGILEDRAKKLNLVKYDPESFSPEPEESTDPKIIVEQS